MSQGGKDWAGQKRGLTPQEQIKEINDELTSLKALCEAYDAGAHTLAAKIATSVTILMRNEGRDQQKPCPINRFGNTPKFLNTIRAVNFKNLLCETPAVSLNINTGPGGRFEIKPVLDGGPLSFRE